MKTIKTKNNRIPVVIGSFVILLLIALLAFWYYSSNISNNDEKKAETINNEGKKDFIENTDNNGTPIGNDPDNSTTSSVSLSAKKESNGSVTIFTKLLSFPEGTCTLEITGESTNLTKSSPVIYQDEFSSCAGFTISSQEASTVGTGSWTINLTAKNEQTTITGKISFMYEAS